MAAKKPTKKAAEVKIDIADLDYTELTLGQVEEAEELLGHELDLASEKPTAKALVAIIYVRAKAKNPNVTIDDVRNISFSELAKAQKLSQAAKPKRPTRAGG